MVRQCAGRVRAWQPGGRWRAGRTVVIRGGGRGIADQFSLVGPVSAPGMYPFTEGYGAGAFHAEVALDANTAQNTARAIYVLTTGSVTVEAERDGRIRGRFHGTARLLDGTAVIEVADGRFDVPNNLPRPVD